jgi:hypothetical protein
MIVYDAAGFDPGSNRFSASGRCRRWDDRVDMRRKIAEILRADGKDNFICDSPATKGEG